MNARRLAGKLAGPIPVLLLLLIATALAYLPGLHNEFVFDDVPYLLENPLFDGEGALPIVTAAFGGFHAGNWHPLTWLSHALDLAVFGREPAGHRAVNIALHLVTAAVLWLLLRRLTGAPWASLAGAGLFALHPLNVETVAWIAERKNILSTLFGLLAVHAYLSWAGRPSAGRYVLLIALFVLSLLSKSMLVTLPVLLLVLDGWPLGRIGKLGWRRAVCEKVPLFAVSVAFGIVAIFAQRAVTAIAPLERFPLGSRFINAVISTGRYLWFTVRPTELAAFYPHPAGAVPWTEFVLALTFVLGVTVLVLGLRRRRPWLLAGWLFYLVALGPVIGILQVGDQAMADRYAYVPLIGVFLVAATALAGVRRALAAPAAVAAVVVLAGLGWLTSRQAQVWKDALTLFGHALSVTERNYLAHYNYGVALDGAGRTREAMEQYRETVRLHPDAYGAWTNMAVILCRQGRFSEAVPLLRESVRIRPESPQSWFNLATALSDTGRSEESIPYFQRGFALRPDDPAALRNLGVAYMRLARYEEAADRLAGAARLSPSAATENDLGFALESLGRREEAEAHYRRSVELDPSPANLAHRNLARLLRGRW